LSAATDQRRPKALLRRETRRNRAWVPLDPANCAGLRRWQYLWRSNDTHHSFFRARRYPERVRAPLSCPRVSGFRRGHARSRRSVARPANEPVVARERNRQDLSERRRWRRRREDRTL